MGKLEGSVAVVTGGANGLGKSIVEHFVQEGARVVIADFAYKRGARLAAELGKAATFVNTDVRKEDDVKAALSAAVETFGKDRTRWVHPDCGFWMLKRSVADRKMHALVQGRDLYLGI